MNILQLICVHTKPKHDVLIDLLIILPFKYYEYT